MNAVTPTEQTRPHSVEAEQQLLGAVLLDNDRLYRVPNLRDEHFFDPVHARMFDLARKRILADHLVSPVTLMQDMASDVGLTELGGQKYVLNLASGSISGSAVAEYGQMLIELHARRAMQAACEDVMAKIGQDTPAADLAAGMELFLQAQDFAPEPRSMPLERAHAARLGSMLELRDNGPCGVPTGLSALDEAVVLAPGRYTVIGAATSMGKSALAAWLAHAAASRGHGVAFASIEMPEADIAARMASIDAQVPYKAFDQPMSQDLLEKVGKAMRAQRDWPMEVLGSSVRDVPSILSECKRLKRVWRPREGLHGLSLLIVDYIQLVRGRGQSAVERLSQVANDFTQVAKLLNCHVIALAQIDRAIGDRDDPTPRLNDLRGSGDLEFAPANVLFLHRPHHYLLRKPAPKDVEKRADHEAELSRWKDKAKLIVAKARMGELGEVEVGCDMATNRFWDVARTGEMEF